MQDQVNKDQQSVSELHSQATSAAQSTADAEAKVAAAKQATAAAEKSMDIAGAKADVDKAQSDVSTAKSTVTEAQTVADKAAADKANASQTADNAKANLNKTTANINAVKSDLDKTKADTANAQSNLTTAQVGVANAQKVLDNAKNTSTVNLAAEGISVTVSDAAKAAAASLLTGNANNSKFLSENLVAIARGLKITYKPTAADWSQNLNYTDTTKSYKGQTIGVSSIEYVDAFKTLSDAQKTHFEDIYLAVINSIRTQLGMPGIISADTVNGTTKVAAVGPTDTAGGFTLYARAFYPAKQNDGNIKWLDRVPANPITTYNMALLKDNLINYSVLQTLTSNDTDGFQGVYAASVLQPILGFSKTKEATKVLADKISFQSGGPLLFLSIDIATVNNDATYTSSANIPALETALADAKIKLTSAQNALTTVQSKQAAAQSVYDQAAARHADAQAAYSKAVIVQQTAVNAKSYADNALATAETTLTKAETTLAAAQKVLEESQQDLTVKQAKLNAARAAQSAAEKNLATAQTKQTEADTAVTDAKAQRDKDQAALQAAKNKLTSAKQAVTYAEANLYRLNHSQDVLAAAKDAQAKAEAALATAQTAVDQAEKTLSIRQADLTTAQDVTTKAEVALAAANANLADAQAHLEASKQALKIAQVAESLAENVSRQQHRLDSEAKAKVDGYRIVGGRVVDYGGKPVAGWTVINGQMVDMYGNVIARVATKASVKKTSFNNDVSVDSRMTRLHGTASLPQAGEQRTSGLSVFGLVVVAILGMFGYSQRKRRV
ncbi:hypothetical protein Lpl14_00520 [Lacticaseibacillus paracasei subsp. tolerans Lpl14]|uniref:Gram-positive cocci surface proteins LPxTG domain-containing protein n=1 Tax=Lacticaseibacillus paracasei subsp. tolerans Lpl14 TaxID=1256229 RepID=A0A829H236_LACPA|nr:hypothetical protein Lpl14_00520 [Lacticaseibacillus paracasei subsp. tolerans Lpl14]